MPEGELRITKVKSDGSKVRLEYERTHEGRDPDEFTLQCCDVPLPAFTEALQALAADVVAICELPADALTTITVRGVTVTWTHDVMGACVTALKALKTANAPLVLNTPHLPSESYSGAEGDPNPVMPAGMVSRLSTLLNEAVRYLNGDRAQGDLLGKPEAA